MSKSPDFPTSTTLRQNYQRLFQFDLWTIRSLILLMEREENFADRIACLAFLSHIVTIQEMWFNRVLTIPVIEVDDPWAEYSPEELRIRAKEVNRKWMDLIADEEIDLNTMLSIPREDGSKRSMTVREVLDHLLVHGQYHRAQIALFLKKSGIDSPGFDYISYTRSFPDAGLLSWDSGVNP